MRKLCLFTCMICCLSSLFAQDVVIYFNYKWIPCHMDDAVYLSINKKLDSVLQRTDYYMSTRKMKMEGYYKLDSNVIMHGEFRNYYANGLPESIISYHNNRKEGPSISFYPTGRMRDSFNFRNNIPVGYCVSWYASGFVQTEMQMDSAATGSGLVIGFFEDGTVSFKGKLNAGLRKSGNWFYYHQNGNKASVLQYSKIETFYSLAEAQVKKDPFEFTYYDSTVIPFDTICYDGNGVEQSACTFVNQLPQFAKGKVGWINYLGSQMADILFKFRTIPSKTNYKAFFTVDTDGSTKDVMLDNKVEPRLDSDVSYIFQRSKKWIPASHNNRIIPLTHAQSILFPR